MENNKNIEKTIHTYTAAWNEADHEAIREKITKCWAANVTYTDKLTETITGQEAIINLICQSYEVMGQRTFKVLGIPETHHQKGRFRWLAIRPEGYTVEGMDYFEFDEQSRITRIVGFF